MRRLLGIAFCAGIASGASANVLINEALGSTTGTDSEFIELYNNGLAPVDISGWRIQLWDSDSGAPFGGSDGSAPYIVPAATILAPGDHYLMGNTTFATAYSMTPDLLIAENAIENSSYTMILKDAALATQDSVFVWDGGATDAANDAGAPITPGATIGPDGANLPAGFYRVGDGNSLLWFLEFSPVPAPSATPGGPNIPEPATLALLALGGLLAVRRR